MSPLASCHGNLVHLKTLVKCSELTDHVTLRTQVSFCLCGTGCALGMLLKQGQSSKGNCFRCSLFGLWEAGRGKCVPKNSEHPQHGKVHFNIDWFVSFNWFVLLLLPNRFSINISLPLCALWWLVKFKGKKIKPQSIHSFYTMMSCCLSQLLDWFLLCTSYDIKDAKGDMK